MGTAPALAPKGGMDDAFGELFDTKVPTVVAIMPALHITNV